MIPSEVPKARNWLINGWYSDWTLTSVTLRFLEKKLGRSNTTLENILSNCVMPLGGELIILSRFFYAQETKFLEGNFMHIKIKARAKNCSSIFFLNRKVSSLSLEKYFRIYNDKIPVENLNEETKNARIQMWTLFIMISFKAKRKKNQPF